jgi:hypothetical protein
LGRGGPRSAFAAPVLICQLEVFFFLKKKEEKKKEAAAVVIY